MGAMADVYDSPLRTPSRAHARGRHPPRARRGPGQAGGAEGDRAEGRHDGLDDAGADLEHGQGRASRTRCRSRAMRASTRRSSTSRRRTCASSTPTMLPNGAYFWRVRSIDTASESSKWSGVRKFTKKWNAVGGAADAGEPERDRLSESRRSSPGRPCRAPSTYRVSVATGAAGGGVDAPGGIISNGALAWKQRRQADHDRRTRTSPSRRRCTRAPTTGRSCRSTPRATPARRRTIFSFAWIWAGTTTPTVTDMVPGVEIYDPLFQWARDSGRRELRDRDQHHLGLRDRLAGVLGATTTATSFAPTRDAAEQHLLLARPRRRSAGPGGPLEQRPDVRQDLRPDAVPGRRNLTVCNSKLDADRAGGNVNEPVVTWGTVPGARHYELQTAAAVARPTIYFTANTAWTPFALDRQRG